MQFSLEFQPNNKSTEAFDEAYKILNPAQKQAVDHTEGPVLVVAGPGTGKTQILALRIGQILRTQDVKAHNILCMTFTEAGVVAMRNRLLKFIGPEAFNVPIFTFHAFCNQVIQDNLEYFGDYQELQPVSDLERIEIMEELIKSFPQDSLLKRKYGDPYADSYNLQSFFNLIKKESWTIDYVVDEIEEAIIQLEVDPKMLYKNNSKHGKKGTLKKAAYEKERKKYDKLIAAAKVFKDFEELMKVKSRYDYEDMLLWVIRAFKEHPDLLLSYQERYQYFLVDEFQDTNGAQKSILEILASYWDVPNLFVVGDDDQSIFKFQGASITNIEDFYKAYNPELIVLTDNYRSSQYILDAASKLIIRNEDRLLSKMEGIDKALIGKGEFANFKVKPKIACYKKVAQEEADIVRQVMELKRIGVPLHEIAIIYRKHKVVDNLITVFEKLNVPLNVKRRVNILEEPLVVNILKVLKYIWKEHQAPGSAENLLFELMHFSFFGLDTRDIAKIANKCRYRGKEYPVLHWRDAMTDPVIINELNFRDPKSIARLNKHLESWIKDLSTMTLQTLFEKILKFGNIIGMIMESDQRTWSMQVITTLFDFIKAETSKNFKISLGELLEVIQRMEDNKLPIPLNKIVHAEDGVNFVTAHGAKGLEFEYVFMISSTRDNWEKQWRGGNFNFSYPDALKSSDNEVSVEDERRLFFVGMTRAKKFLQISYAEEDAKAKTKEKSRFTAETEIDEVKQMVPEKVVFEYYEDLLKYIEPEIQLLDHDLIDRMIEHYVLTVTNLNKYLKCPLSFYFDVILRVPTAKTKYIGFGNAVHKALNRYFTFIKREDTFPDKALLIKYFKEGMEYFAGHFTEMEMEDLTSYGEELLERYYDTNVEEWKKLPAVESEWRVRNVQYEGIPIKGDIDRVDIYKDFVTVRDYKTGKSNTEKYKTPNTKTPYGGEYWRQIVFYKILIDLDHRNTWKVKDGTIDFIQENQYGKIVQQLVEINPSDIELMGSQIKEVYQKIKNHEFTEMCNEERCQWCNFVKNEYVFN